MRFVIDMNLPPEWVGFLAHSGYESVHWSAIGDPKAADYVIMDWAKKNGYFVFTHDLDFGAILAATNADSPSVLQIRTHNVMPDAVGELVLSALQQFESHLEAGALITLDEYTRRARILPIKR